MLDFKKENFTGHPKFHPQMAMFILDTMVPRVEREGVSVACVNVITLPVTVQKLVSSVDTFDSRLRDLEATAGLEVGGGGVYQETTEETRAGETALMEREMKMGFLISLETFRVSREVETVSLGVTLNNISCPPHPQVQIRIWR